MLSKVLIFHIQFNIWNVFLRLYILVYLYYYDLSIYPSIIPQKWLIECIYPNSRPQISCNTRSIFKRNITGSNSEFSFSLTGCRKKVKHLSRFYYLLMTEGRRNVFLSSPRELVRKWNPNSFMQVLIFVHHFYSIRR